ncbi:synaptopodin 2-like protein isoform X2 [Scyliorhinus canicula]|uniref:synaptopodin 2-like protein isoform X2 n=1 Tax=Scyliorhinus canicula TaxID=7830 RepID=UPI0018F56AF8|nr:synaptopodin 2-like protein isoform X2 [Scyliorhinus canicula]
MGATKEALVTLAGGAPWGFRLQGGAQQLKPLQVAKVRKRGKACRAGLLERDILLTINGRSCNGISHADAMNIIDSSNGTLAIWVKRVSSTPESGSDHPEASLQPTPPSLQPTPPGQASKVTEPMPQRHSESRGQRLSYTSPPDSEAYYGETDSDADYPAGEKQRRQRRKCPSAAPRQNLSHFLPSSADEASELSELDSAPETPRAPPARSESPPSTCPLSQPQHRAQLPLDQPSLPPGLTPRSREMMFQPRRVEAKINIWQPKVEVALYPSLKPMENPSTTHNPSPTYPITWSAQHGTEDIANRQGIVGTSEADSGFQEVNAHAAPPEHKLLPTRSRPCLREMQLVPMVGPVNNPVAEILTTTYKEKAKQAKLHRSESVQEKQVKEARTKCKTIASLLTSAPNPHSKGVLMFKKRRQRAKKYTLVSYGSVDEEKQNIDEDGELIPTSESEFDEEMFSDAKSLTNQSTGSDWDGSYLDIEKSQTEPQGLTESKGKGVMLFEHQRQRAGEYTVEDTAVQRQRNLQKKTKSESEVRNYSLMNGEGAWPRNSGVYGGSPVSDMLNSYAEMNLSPRVNVEPSVPGTRPSEQHHSQHLVQGPSFLSGVTNRTARPFTPGFQQSQATPTYSVSAPVLFRKTAASAMSWEQGTERNKPATPCSPPSEVVCQPTVNPVTQSVTAKKAVARKRMGTPYSSVPGVMSPPPGVMSPPPGVMSPPPGVMSPPHAVMSPPHAVMSPPPGVMSPPHAVMSPPHAVMSPPPGVMSPPHAVMSPPHAVMSHPSAVMSPPPGMMSPPSTVMSPPLAVMPSPPTLMSPPPAVMSPPPTVVPPPLAVMSRPPTVMSPPSAVMSSPPAVMSPPPAMMSPHRAAARSLSLMNPYSPPLAPVTSTAKFHVSPALPLQKETEATTATRANTQAPSIGSTSSTAWSANQQSENLATREQRISVPASKTGILQEARRRSTRKPMFTKTEQVKTSPNPELLSLVQNLDEKKPDHFGAGFESGPEEDFLSLGAEASNFMQSQARRQKFPPPVAPKPSLKTQFIDNGSPLVNGNTAPGTLQLKGKGADLFAKRQSRMDKFIVDSVPTYTSQARGPSPTPSLPSTWKYSPNIRAPPPIGYNPMYSPSYPPAACKSQGITSATKTERKWKPGGNQKVGIQAIDFMRHQPYQLNPAMFSFNESNLGTQSLQKSTPSRQPGQQSFISTKHVPVKTTRACEIQRFSTPLPTMTPTVIAPRSATTLAEPVWMSAPPSPPPAPVKISTVNFPAPVASKQNRKTREGSQEVTSEPKALHFSSKEDIQMQKKTLHHVPRPRFSAVRGGMNPHTWRPGSF